MDAIGGFWMENVGSLTHSFTIDLGPNSNGYLVEAYLVLTEGDQYAHIFVSEICTLNDPSEVLCGVQENESAAGSVTFLPSNTVSVTYSLHTKGGHHRVEGAIFAL